MLTPSILLVEDNEVDVELFQRAMVRMNLSNQVRVAQHGVEALEILRGENGQDALEHPFLILLDINMPLMDGFEFLDALCDDPGLRRSVVFILTTSEDDKDKAAAYDRRVAGYFSKHDAGTGFENVINVLKAYCSSVHFPPAATE